MKKKLFFSVCLSLPLALFPLSAPAEEGSPLLSVDDLIALEDSYEAFLNELGDLAVQRGLLSEEDRAAWHDAQLGDYFQNGGYGSILISYMPGAMGYTREEDTLLSLSAAFDGGRLELMTMRRYTPGDSTLSGLMLTPSVLDESGAPMDAHYVLSATSGVFMKWDALLGTYVTVGANGGERWRNDRLERPDARRRRQRSGAHPADFARGRPDGAYGSETAAVRRRRGV